MQSASLPVSSEVVDVLRVSSRRSNSADALHRAGVVGSLNLFGYLVTLSNHPVKSIAFKTLTQLGIVVPRNKQL